MTIIIYIGSIFVIVRFVQIYLESNYQKEIKSNISNQNFKSTHKNEILKINMKNLDEFINENGSNK